MTKWPPVPAGEVFELIRRPVVPDPGSQYIEIGVRSFGKGIFHKVPVTGSDIGTKRVFEIGANELVVNIVFAWEGAVAVSSTDDAGKIGSHRFLTYRADSDRIDPHFARAYLVSEPGREAVLAARPGSAGRNRTLSQANFERLMIPLPSIDDQRRVAARLAAITWRQEALRRSWQHAARTADGLIEALLARSGQDAPVAALGELLHLRRDPVPVQPHEHYRTAGVYSYARGMFWRPAQPGSEIGYATLYRVAPGQLVLSKLFGWEGAIAIATHDFAGAFVSSEFPTFDIDRARADLHFLRAVVSRPEFYRSLAVSGMGDRRQRVNPASFLSAEICLPSLEQQRLLGVADEERRQLAARLIGQASIVDALGQASLNEVFGGRM